MGKSVSKPKIQRKSPADPKPPMRWDVFLLEAMSRFGPFGTAVFVFLYILLEWPDQDRKNKFFDTFFLLQTGTNDRPYLILFGMALVTMFILQGLHFRTERRIMKKKIDQLEENVKDLEGKLTEQKQIR